MPVLYVSVFFLSTISILGLGFFMAVRNSMLLTRQQREVTARLRAQGFSVIEKIRGGPSFPFPEFRHRRIGTTTVHITAPGTSDSAFLYTYKQGPDDGYVRLGCAVVPVPFFSPGISIWQGSRSILGVVARNRVDTDSEKFNSLYEVECKDERFAYTLLSYEMVDWFLNDPAYSERVTVRINHNWMLLIRRDADYEELLRLLWLAQATRSQLPAVLTSMYPLPR